MQKMEDTSFSKTDYTDPGIGVIFVRGVLPKILGGGVPYGSQNPGPISD